MLKNSINWDKVLAGKSEILFAFDVIPSCELAHHFAGLINHCVKHKLIIDDVKTDNFLYIRDSVDHHTEVNNDLQNKALFTFKKLK